MTGLWIEDDSTIQSLVHDFFQQLYIVGQLTSNSGMVKLISCLITDEINAILLAPISNSEVEKVVFELGSSKALLLIVS